MPIDRITAEQADTAYRTGYIIDTGQISDADIAWLNRQAQEGHITRVLGYFPDLVNGFGPLKKVYIGITTEELAARPPEQPKHQAPGELITLELYAEAQRRGYILSIGQLSTADRSYLGKLARQGEIKGVWAYSPDLITGFGPLKRLYIGITAEQLASRRRRPPRTATKTANTPTEQEAEPPVRSNA